MAILVKPKTLSSFLFPVSRYFSSFTPSFSSTVASSSKPLIPSSPPPPLFFLRRIRGPPFFSLLFLDSLSVKSFSTRAVRSSLNDPNPNYSNRPPKETILLDGCDFEHWLVVMEPPPENATRDEIIDRYIKTLSQVLGSEEEARMKIYSVSTRHYYAFGALVSEELSYKIKELPGVRWVLPDSYLDVKNKDYGGEPFINGQAVPYDPKYHEEWVRNNARANERNRRNDRPRNYDRSKNYERRRESMQPRDNQSREMPPSNQGMQHVGPNTAGMPPNNMGGMPPSNMGGMPPDNRVGMPSNNMGRMPPNNMGGGMAPNNMGGRMPGMQQNMGNVPPNQGWSSNMPGNAQNFQNGPDCGNTPYQGAAPNAQYQYQNNYAPNMDAGNMPGGNCRS
ncbi:multiple organellar RNA editing factor 8, chloroplastic/mitochondrial-like [Durio zibethinus]|uniref:Multiple organellar RNA editing factor 8, chloroplastic/mitochondrial-like n=1 Tax=Durio zibethinus TaxID=66656 RepID=A0A6P5WP11_DURZI|nr:multiple organellar RNA editing factor 8, chloroplastic/mitochondrial-like [Durio zibethinus]